MALSDRGDGQAAAGPSFEGLVASHYRSLYQFAYSLTRTEADASDLTQQAFYIWARKGHQLRDVNKVKTWLFTTLHREFLRTRQRRTRFPEVDLESADAELPSLESGVADAMDAAAVVALLAQVDAAYRAPLTLFYMNDHSYQEIAAILEVPLGTVQSRISRGKAQLQRLLVQQAPAAATGGA